MYTCLLYTSHNLQLLGKNLKKYIQKCTHFAKKQLVSGCYTMVSYHAISRLYIHKKAAVYLSDSRVAVFFFVVVVVVVVVLFLQDIRNLTKRGSHWKHQLFSIWGNEDPS